MEEYKHKLKLKIYKTEAVKTGNDNKKNKLFRIFEFVKYGIMLILTIVCTITIRNPHFGLIAVLGILCTWSVTELLRRFWVVDYILNGIFTLIFLVQVAVMYFGRSFLTLMMLTNLGSLEDLSDMFYIYIPLVILVIVVSFLPIYKRRLLPLFVKEVKSIILSTAMIICTCLILAFSGDSSPYTASVQLVQEIIEFNNSKVSDASDEELAEISSDYLNEETTDQGFISRPESFAEKENVILILTEGMSVNCVEYQDLMPNFKEFRDSTISFTNYYNHTFATYRGIIGQLYSGYQENNLDTNGLISIEDILRDNGYETYFINTEPKNTDFSNYLASLSFDEVITETDVLNGTDNSISDKDAYELLYDTAMEKSKDDKPFFIVIYTFGTHVNTDSPDETYGDGSNSMLNRCANVDKWFGEFFDKFKNSSLNDDTMLILTSDHCSYEDAVFQDAFPDYERDYNMLDTVPFAIYYNGVTPTTIDVNGRNSLDTAPTILDLLDISGENYFLGQSLFADEKASTLETTFQTLTAYFTTEGSKIVEMSGDEKKEAYDLIYKYFQLKNGISRLEDIDAMQINFENGVLIISVNTSYKGTKLGVLCEDFDGGAMQWYSQDTSSGVYEIPISNFDNTAGFYQFHLQGVNEDGDAETITSESRYISEEEL